MGTDGKRPIGASSSWRRLHVGDARDLGEILPKRKCLDVTVTSPPYGPTIDYGDSDQIGFGQAYEAYSADMRRVLEVLHDRTRLSGSLWLIVDTFKQRAKGGMSRLVPLPFDLADLAEQVGWTLQDVVIWHKDHTLPWSGQGRLRNSFEYVLMFTKGPRFKYRLSRIREIADLQDWWQRYPERYSPSGAAPTNVWNIPIPRQGSWGNGVIEHRCPLPDALVQRILELSSDRGDTVCDPFAGVGTVLAVAEALDRRSVGVELVDAYAEQFYASVLPDTVERVQALPHSNARLRFARDIARLRHAKLVRILVKRLESHGTPVIAALARATVRSPSRAAPHSVGSQHIQLFVSTDGDADRARTAAAELLRRRPLSKFGIEATIEIAPVGAWGTLSVGNWSRVSLTGNRFARFDNHVEPTNDDPIVLINIRAAELSRALEPLGTRDVTDEQSVNR